MTGQPSGTVTMVFTDIEGSTRLLERLGRDAYARSLDLHRRLLRDAFDCHGGYEVDYEGDGFFVAFTSAGEAVAAAVEAQEALHAAEWPPGCDLRVRIGVHTGEPLAVPPKYVGLDVHKAARIMAAAHGGQVLISGATRDLLGPSIPLRDRGVHRLRDLSDRQHLYQVVTGSEGAGDDRPLRTLENRPTNLPTQPTPLVGRGREVREAARLLRQAGARLVTFTGPGGIGKTRLSLQVAAELLDDFPDGVFFVTLASLSDPESVLPAVAQTLGIREEAGESLPQTLARELTGKRMLLLLDNFEHLQAAAPSVAELLRSTTALHLIVTSRWPLHVAAEREFPIASLPVPVSAGPIDLNALAQYDAVTLFIERARAVNPDFQVTNENAAAVAEICARLDGLPLAIELAAARIRILPPAALLGRLDQRLKLLTGGARDAPERHRTLRRTLEWSYDLLEPHERDLFVALAVFVGSATLDAVEFVCAADDNPVETLDALESLVEKNLVRQRSSDDEPRFWMLETVREFAAERFSTIEQARAIRTRHVAYYRRYVESLSETWLHPAWEPAIDRLLPQAPNVAAAAQYAADEGDPASAGALALAGARLAQSLGSLSEAAAIIDAALNRPGCRPELRGPLLVCRGWSELGSGRAAGAVPFFEQALDASRAVGDLVFAAYALSKLGLAATVLGDARRADELFRSAMTEADAADDAWMRTEAATQRANLAAATGDLDEAAALFAETAVAWEQIGDHSAAAHSLSNIGFAQVRLGRIAEAAPPAVTSARFYARLRHPQGTLYSLVLLAAIFGRLGRPDRAHALLGAASALEAETEWALEPAEAAMRDDVAADVRLMVTPEAAASISRATDGHSPYDLVAAAADELEGAVPIGTRH